MIFPKNMEPPQVLSVTLNPPYGIVLFVKVSVKTNTCPYYSHIKQYHTGFFVTLKNPKGLSVTFKTYWELSVIQLRFMHKTI